MTGHLLRRAVPAPARRRLRQGAQRVARIRTTRAWPVVRPAYRLARRVVNVPRLLGVTDAPQVWQAQQYVDRVRRRLRSLGFTAPALADLQRLAANPDDPLRQRHAAFELGLWYADQQDPESARAALPYLRTAATDEVDPVRLRRAAVLAAECHARVGDPAAAAQAVAHARSLGDEVNASLAEANLAAQEEPRLAAVNRALAAHRLAPVSLTPPDGVRPAFDRLRSTTPAGVGSTTPAGGTGGVLRRRWSRRRRTPEPVVVTVIVPAHDAARTLGTALDSLCAQTWPHLEVLVVDDASTDGTADVAREYARRDPRVQVLTTDDNAGPYVARNLALQQATGTFVTCHDADDWSHPAKIEQQVRYMLRHPQVVGTTSQQARADADLRFSRRGQPGLYVFRNLSSFLFRRAPVVEALGCWDSVRFGADEELVQRAIAAFGAHRVVDLHTGPLCFQRQAPGSLTTDTHLGYHGFLMGARREYQEAYTRRHRTAATLRYDFPQQQRPFGVPAPMLPTRPGPGRRHVDVVLASDFRMLGGSTQSCVEEVEAQLRMGVRTGLVPMARYGVDPTRQMVPAMRELIDGDRVQVFTYGEQIDCDLLVVRYPPVLEHPQRYLPDVRAREVRVVVNQPPMSDYGPNAERRYHLDRCAEHCRAWFGTDAVWHPIGPLVRQALHDHHAHELPAVTLADDDWVNIIDVDAWRRPARPTPGPRVRLGRHSRDHPVKWPATAAELLAAYPDAPGYEVHVLGGGQTPQELLGYWPEHWHVWQFGERDPRDFLAGLDVFVYYTHPDWVESFGRVIIEAMATGVPVVLPHHYRDLLGDAALYAKPEEVRDQVDRLAGDPAAYQAQAEAAQQYVEVTFGYSMHARRLRALLPG